MSKLNASHRSILGRRMLVTVVTQEWELQRLGCDCVSGISLHFYLSHSRSRQISFE